MPTTRPYLKVSSVGETIFSSSGSVYAPVPLEIELGDLELLAVACEQTATITVPSGWTLLRSISGTRHVALFSRQFTGSSSSVTVLASGSFLIATRFSIRNCNGTGKIIGAPLISGSFIESATYQFTPDLSNDYTTSFSNEVPAINPATSILCIGIGASNVDTDVSLWGSYGIEENWGSIFFNEATSAGAGAEFFGTWRRWRGYDSTNLNDGSEAYFTTWIQRSVSTYVGVSGLFVVFKSPDDQGFYQPEVENVQVTYSLEVTGYRPKEEHVMFQPLQSSSDMLFLLEKGAFCSIELEAESSVNLNMLIPNKRSITLGLDFHSSVEAKKETNQLLSIGTGSEFTTHALANKEESLSMITVVPSCIAEYNKNTTLFFYSNSVLTTNLSTKIDSLRNSKLKINLMCKSVLVYRRLNASFVGSGIKACKNNKADIDFSA